MVALPDCRRDGCLDAQQSVQLVASFESLVDGIGGLDLEWWCFGDVEHLVDEITSLGSEPSRVFYCKREELIARLVLGVPPRVDLSRLALLRA